MTALIHLKRRAVYTLAVIGVTLAVVGAGTLWWKIQFSEPPVVQKVEVDSTQIAEAIQTIGELATANYFYTNVGKFEAQNSFYGYTVPFTTKSFILSYSGEIKAGIPLAEVQVKVTPSTVVITIPYPRILSHEIDYDGFEVFDETKNIFNPITISDYTSFFQDEHHKMEQKAAEKGILDHAREKAVTAIEGLMNSTELLKGSGKKLMFN